MSEETYEKHLESLLRQARQALHDLEQASKVVGRRNRTVEKRAALREMHRARRQDALERLRQAVQGLVGLEADRQN